MAESSATIKLEMSKELAEAFKSVGEACEKLAHEIVKVRNQVEQIDEFLSEKFPKTYKGKQ